MEKSEDPLDMDDRYKDHRSIYSGGKTMNKQGEMRIKNVNKTVMEVFEVTGFSDILTIE